MLGHMLNLPFPFMCGVMVPKHTSVTIVELAGEDGDLITPKIEIYNDARHIVGIQEGEKNDFERMQLGE